MAEIDHFEKLQETVQALQGCLEDMGLKLGEVVIADGLNVQGMPASAMFSAAIKSSRSYASMTRDGDYRHSRPGIQMEIAGVRISVR